ncbi:class II glutamine amidotransferase [Aliiroseovarius sp. F20344]|uniref:class II glutamine amidotransferase n=1 Tax=Aliiroseovarius sp. F20344 TaxID=2926414 RepID=UPI001FF44FCA|nr:class II glutamine amidotransferase [Aliiroseovarius sp. F20344]MCK0143560.1 class II glutamine amidotransferase [Aliiroseovarius sp. F20344]
MCRWAAYLGEPIFMEEVVVQPGHSLIQQSQEAEEAKTAINADGFGLAWYDHRPEPGLYRDVLPAWSDPNLRAIARQVKSPLFLAHVRASTGSATSRNNCHPFAYGRWSFMHNGQIGGFEQFRKRADMLIPDALYSQRKGATDSEVLFLLTIDAIGQGADVPEALTQATQALLALSHAHGTSPHLRLSAAMSDGQSLWAARCASDQHAPSVYYRWSESRQGWAVVSEPLDQSEGDWTCLPPGHIAQFSGKEVAVTAFQP